MTSWEWSEVKNMKIYNSNCFSFNFAFIFRVGLLLFYLKLPGTWGFLYCSSWVIKQGFFQISTISRSDFSSGGVSRFLRWITPPLPSLLSSPLSLPSLLIFSAKSKIISFLLDECQFGLHSCDSGSTCVNTPGNYTCTCPSGYKANWNKCVGE